MYFAQDFRIIMKTQFLFLAITGIVQCRNTQQPIKVDNHISQPLIGFGTWNLKESPDNTSSAVALALEAGYRQIDCAAAYGNEKEVGKGIAEGLKKIGLNREDVWITSKLWNDQFVHALHTKHSKDANASTATRPIA
jgi:alcohol dehydrogenase (NADP+)